MPGQRVQSIDVFRAVTMFLMIFVNDLWTLFGVPAWLEHMPAGADGLGFSDIIFPAFLFIVGLSIPLSIQNRRSRGESGTSLIAHIGFRSLALLVMGFFHVNLENYSGSSMLPKEVWEMLITVAFFLVWLDYPRNLKRRKILLQGLGLLILLIMAFLYKGVGHGTVIWMRPQWWGILGLIGWAYLFSSLFYLLFGKSLTRLALLLLLIMILNVYVHLGFPFAGTGLKKIFHFLSFFETTNISLVMGGALATGFYLRWKERPARINLVFPAVTIVMLAYGFLSRPLWGISKIGSTPSWMAICFAISLFGFWGLILLVDRGGKAHWFRWIRAAGTSTLTCYLLPYIHYPLISLWPGLRLPEFLRTGALGIGKSLVYALIIILIAEALSRIRIRMKL